MPGVQRPILLLDVDGVISLFGFAEEDPPPGGRFHTVDGVEHHIHDETGRRLTELAERFELTWATGWRHKANEHLPRLLELETGELPTVEFTEEPRGGSAIWKVGGIDRHAGDRPLAWIDDNIDEQVRKWATRRRAPTLLLPTDAMVGISQEHVDELLEWAQRTAA